MNRMFLASTTALVAALASGCVLGRARLVHQTQTGGTYALEGDRQKAMEEASQGMAQHCQGPYTVVEQGEHVVGTETAGGSETYETYDGTVVEEGGQSTREATEWRVRYQCGGQPAPGYGPPPPGGEPPPPPEGGYEEPYEEPYEGE